MLPEPGNYRRIVAEYRTILVFIHSSLRFGLRLSHQA